MQRMAPDLELCHTDSGCEATCMIKLGQQGHSNSGWVICIHGGKADDWPKFCTVSQKLIDQL